MASIVQFIRTLLAIKSMVVIVLLMLLVIRSHFVGDRLARGERNKSLTLASANGMLMYRVAHDGSSMALPKGSWEHDTADPSAVIKPVDGGSHASVWNHLGFSFQHRALTAHGSGLLVTATAPHWFIVALMLPTPLLWCWRRMKRRMLETETVDAWCPACQAQRAVTDRTCPACRGQVVLAA